MPQWLVTDVSIVLPSVTLTVMLAFFALTDDGNGFDPSVPPQDGQTHVDLSNVRERLRYAGAALRIGPGPEGVTEAVIVIPKSANAGRVNEI